MRIVFYSTFSNFYEGNKASDTTFPLRADTLEQFGKDNKEHTFIIATQIPGMFLLDMDKNDIKRKARGIEYRILKSDKEEEIAQEIMELKPDLAVAVSFYAAPFDWLTIKDALTADFLRKKGIKTICHSLDFTLDTFDKWRTHNLLQKYGIKTPEAVYLHHELFMNAGNRTFIKSNVYRSAFFKQLKKLNYPVVIKDCTGLSSYGMDVVNTYEEAVNLILSKKTNGDRIIEEFISGNQFGIEAIKTDMQEKAEIYPAMLFSVNRYGITSPKQSVKAGPVTNKAFNLEELHKTINKICEISGFNGIAQIDLVFNGENWFVIEINPRLSGMTTTYEAITGTSIFEKLLCAITRKQKSDSQLKFAVNLKFPLLEEIELKKLYGCTGISSVHQIENLGAKQLREMGYCEAIITGNSREELRNNLENLKETFPEKMEEIFYRNAVELISRL